jgi:hypothetical protein
MPTSHMDVVAYSMQSSGPGDHVAASGVGSTGSAAAALRAHENLEADGSSGWLDLFRRRSPDTAKSGVSLTPLCSRFEIGMSPTRIQNT